MEGSSSINNNNNLLALISAEGSIRDDIETDEDYAFYNTIVLNRHWFHAVLTMYLHESQARALSATELCRRESIEREAIEDTVFVLHPLMFQALERFRHDRLILFMNVQGLLQCEDKYETFVRDTTCEAMATLYQMEELEARSTMLTLQDHDYEVMMDMEVDWECLHADEAYYRRELVSEEFEAFAHFALLEDNFFYVTLQSNTSKDFLQQHTFVTQESVSREAIMSEADVDFCTDVVVPEFVGMCLSKVIQEKELQSNIRRDDLPATTGVLSSRHVDRHLRSVTLLLQDEIAARDSLDLSERDDRSAVVYSAVFADAQVTLQLEEVRCRLDLESDIWRQLSDKAADASQLILATRNRGDTARAEHEEEVDRAMIIRYWQYEMNVFDSFKSILQSEVHERVKEVIAPERLERSELTLHQVEDCAVNVCMFSEAVMFLSDREALDRFEHIEEIETIERADVARDISEQCEQLLWSEEFVATAEAMLRSNYAALHEVHILDSAEAYWEVIVSPQLLEVSSAEHGQRESVEDDFKDKMMTLIDHERRRRTLAEIGDQEQTARQVMELAEDSTAVIMGDVVGLEDRTFLLISETFQSQLKVLVDALREAQDREREKMSGVEREQDVLRSLIEHVEEPAERELSINILHSEVFERFALEQTFVLDNEAVLMQKSLILESEAELSFMRLIFDEEYEFCFKLCLGQIVPFLCFDVAIPTTLLLECEEWERNIGIEFEETKRRDGLVLALEESNESHSRDITQLEEESDRAGLLLEHFDEAVHRHNIQHLLNFESSETNARRVIQSNELIDITALEYSLQYTELCVQGFLQTQRVIGLSSHITPVTSLHLKNITRLARRYFWMWQKSFAEKQRTLAEESKSRIQALRPAPPSDGRPTSRHIHGNRIQALVSSSLEASSGDFLAGSTNSSRPSSAASTPNVSRPTSRDQSRDGRPSAGQGTPEHSRNSSRDSRGGDTHQQHPVRPAGGRPRPRRLR
eukprot:PhM_4_TR18103/c0_g1_i1/m.96003